MKGSDMVSVNGTIESVVYHNDQNDYTVLEIADEGGALVTAVGAVPLPVEGERVLLQGMWTYHKEYGRQFSFSSCEKDLPSEVDDILKYLSSRSVKGVGPVTAVKIVNRFGKETFDVMDKHPEWLADIPGITLKKAAAIAESFKQNEGVRGVMMFCKDYIGAGQVTRVYKAFGPGAVGLIRENPYILCENACDIPFQKADEIAHALGFAPDHTERVFSGLRYVLLYNARTSGHTCLPYEKLLATGAALLELPSDRVKETLDDLLAVRRLLSYHADGAHYVMTGEVYNAERHIALKLLELQTTVRPYAAADISAMIDRIELRFGIEYALLQREALYESLRCGVMILTGGPGTGKTTVIKAMLAIFKNLGMKTVLAAPTGRAAKRMSEATGEEAKTVHRMLEMERTGEDRAHFMRNEANPLEEKVVIIDEVSMIDLVLMDALLAALRRGTRLILIGDASQLPSVGAGNVLADMIATEKVRTICLTQIFRQSRESLIVTNAHKINGGEMPILGVTDNDFFYLRRDDEGTIADTVSELMLKRLPKAYGAAIRDRIQVITPSRKGAGGVEILNEILQAAINPPTQCKRERAAHGLVFREGDRVMQVANNYEIEWEKNGVTGAGLFNGDIGTIEQIHTGERYMKIRFDDRLVTYGFDYLEDLELAYAITVHKSQGSEYQVVIIPVYSCPPMLRTRNLLYTAVTRARRMVILVGRADLVREMVQNNREILRYTTLTHRICEFFPK